MPKPKCLITELMILKRNSKVDNQSIFFYWIFCFGWHFQTHIHSIVSTHFRKIMQSVLELHCDSTLSAHWKLCQRRQATSVYVGFFFFFQNILRIEKLSASVYGWTCQLWSDTTMTFSFLVRYFLSWDTWLKVREVFTVTLSADRKLTH